VLTLVYNFTGGDDAPIPIPPWCRARWQSSTARHPLAARMANGPFSVLSLGVPATAGVPISDQTGGTIALTWSALAGQPYQLQFKTNLNQMKLEQFGQYHHRNQLLRRRPLDFIGPDPQRFLPGKNRPVTDQTQLFRL